MQEKIKLALSLAQLSPSLSHPFVGNLTKSTPDASFQADPWSARKKVGLIVTIIIDCSIGLVLPTAYPCYIAGHWTRLSQNVCSQPKIGWLSCKSCLIDRIIIFVNHVQSRFVPGGRIGAENWVLISFTIQWFGTKSSFHGQNWVFTFCYFWQNTFLGRAEAQPLKVSFFLLSVCPSVCHC